MEKAISVIFYHSSYTEKTVLSPILVIVLKHKHFQNKYTQNKEEAGQLTGVTDISQIFYSRPHQHSREPAGQLSTRAAYTQDFWLHGII